MPGAVEPLQRERRAPAAPTLGACVLVREPPDEQREQSAHARERDHLRRRASAAASRAQRRLRARMRNSDSCLSRPARARASPTRRPRRSMTYVTGRSGDAVAVRRDEPVLVGDDRVRDPVRRDEAARVAGRVVAVDADERRRPCERYCVPELLERRRLRLARPAPRRPEVEHDRLAAERRESRRSRCRSSRWSENAGAGPPIFGGGVLVRQPPDEQRRGARRPPRRATACAAELEALRVTGRDDEHRRARPSRGRTATPRAGTCMRMQPCDSE